MTGIIQSDILKQVDRIYEQEWWKGRQRGLFAIGSLLQWYRLTVLRATSSNGTLVRLYESNK